MRIGRFFGIFSSAVVDENSSTTAAAGDEAQLGHAAE
jgi:hypothetical protein